ncbi:hypothetical protein [Streptomyces sp. NPDC020983]|uniref:hypothetical protein n=1 Tax=Streptomyces sp. NPDC020983 TaxID=3365106 RepID=UPI0037A6C60E
MANYMDAARSFFEPQLRLMNLGHTQIEAQNLNQLKESLDRINLAIANPGQFGALGIKFSAGVGAVVARASAGGTITVGVLPILVERKRLVLDRIRTLVPQEQLEDFLATIEEKVKDPEVRQELTSLLSGYVSEQRLIAQEAEHVAGSELDLALHDIEIRERKWRLRKSLLEKEPVAVLVGGLLISVLTIAMVVGMFLHTPAPEILTNAFLLILGFFFGQTTSGGTVNAAPSGAAGEPGGPAPTGAVE